ncbi:MAG: tyrosine-protein phosphatase [Rhodospirillales bacterium]|nr:tyrosine-protein phosphatase [Rhodospirillales bacterium]
MQRDRRRWRIVRRAALGFASALLAGALGMAGWAGYLQATGNVHTVLPGLLYRSAELGERGFERVIARDHIRTVINLRGANPGRPWYEHELAAAKAMGVRHIDLGMSASHVPSVRKLAEIRSVLVTAATPILIHCEGGADRSGLGAALYELWIAHLPPAKAGAQLSFYYGHFPWLGSSTAAMDKAWREVVRDRPGR